MFVNGEESYLAQDYSLSQLLHAAKQKLQDTPYYGRATATFNKAEVDALEHDALEVLNMVRSMRNTFAPVNRTPPEVFSLIPDYWEEYEKDRNLIKLIHICRDWRKVFISRPSLWTYLNFKNVEQTRVYIERSKSAPLEIRLEPPYEEEAFLLAIPHIHRLKTLSVYGDPDELLPVLVEHFSCPLPLLDDLNISFPGHQRPTLPEKLFDGDLSSLRELSLACMITPLPWRDLSNLTTFNLYQVPKDKILLTQLLDFFESAPCLRHIELCGSLPSSSNAPTEQVVPLPHLKDLSIKANRPHSILLNHLSIPAGASLHLEFEFDGENPPISSHLPKSPGSLPNLSHITAVNLCFGSERRFIRLNGPSGELYILGNWTRGEEQSNAGTSQVIQYLSQFDISKTRWLAITLCDYQPPDPAQITNSTVYRTLHCMKDLRIIVLTKCKNLPFIHALNPDKNPDKTILCPRLKQISLYIKHSDLFHVDELVNMAEQRALRGAKLSVIKVTNMSAAALEKGVLLPLREHVGRVKYTISYKPPKWDMLPS